TSLPSYCRNSKKLTILNYEPLLNQVKSKVNTWSESFSFAGRLLLVNTVIAGITNLQLTDEEDTYTVNGSNWNKYNTGSIYKELKNHAPLVQWYNTIWCEGGIPKHNFLACLRLPKPHKKTLPNRLEMRNIPTLDRMKLKAPQEMLQIAHLSTINSQPHFPK
ncbi:LOW QUALITY PROTEIN: hypothetical protein HID58_042963, partial [Brassica napus]